MSRELDVNRWKMKINFSENGIFSIDLIPVFPRITCIRVTVIVQSMNFKNENSR